MSETEPASNDRPHTSVARGASLMVAMRLISRCIGVVSTAILARLLTPDDFGLVVLGSSVLGIAGMLSDLSLGAAIIRMHTPEKAHYDTAWSIGLIRGAIMAAGVVLAAPFVADAMTEPRVMPILWTLAVATMLQAFESIGLVDCQKHMQFGRICRYQFLVRIVSFITTLVLAIVLRSYWALVISTLATSVITVRWSYVLAPWRPRLTLRRWRDLFDFSKWAVLGTYLAIVDNYTMTFLLGWIGGARELGLYSVSQQIAALPASEIAAPIRLPLYAEFARLAGSPVALGRTFVNGFGFMVLVITPMSLGIFVTAPMIAPLALGPQWTGAPAMIQAVVFYALFDAIGHYPQNIFVVMNRQPRLLLLAAIFLSLRVVAAIAGGWLDGAMGAVFGMVATAIFGAVFWFAATLPLVGVGAGALCRSIWRSVVAGATMVLALLALARVWPLAQDAGGLAIQLLGFSALGAVTHVGVLLLLWRVSGCPDGAEAKAIAIAAQMLARLRRRGLLTV